jgi:hypothetical protein
MLISLQNTTHPPSTTTRYIQDDPTHKHHQPTNGTSDTPALVKQFYNAHKSTYWECKYNNRAGNNYKTYYHAADV